MQNQVNKNETECENKKWPNWFWRLIHPQKKNEKEPPPVETPPLPTNYGYGYEAREMVDGRWVLWHNGRACDLKSHSYAWEPGTRFFPDCIGTRKEIDAVAKQIMASRGVFKNTLDTSS